MCRLKTAFLDSFKKKLSKSDSYKKTNVTECNKGTRCCVLRSPSPEGRLSRNVIILLTFISFATGLLSHRSSAFSSAVTFFSYRRACALRD
nr:MAG TPA: hypothetical protein [Caudoviricetes sp.]